MNLFKILNDRINEIEDMDLSVFYNALYDKREESYIKEISNLCENNYFYIQYVKPENEDNYNAGEIIISFDDETRYHECTYVSQDRYFPKVTIQKKQFLNSFIHIKDSLK